MKLNKQRKNKQRAIVPVKPVSKPVARSRPRQNGPRGLFSALGGAAGGYLGGPLGAVLGSKAGDLLSQITGFGAYSVGKNSLVSGNTVPTFRLSTDGIEIAHREFIQDVSGSIAFSLGSLPINPGLYSTFPWLSSVAENFEEYEMLGLVFEYRPSSGSAVSAASAALGVVVYSTEYNVLSPDFISKQQMESYEYSCSSVPFEGMLHPVECAPRSNVLGTMYIRNSAIASGSDQRMYDMGKFEFATQGMQSAYTVGELWVSYHVKLKKPRIPANEIGQWAHITEFPVGSATAAAPLGTTGGVLNSSSTLVGVSSSSTTSITLSAPGTYLINTLWKGSTITSLPIITAGANITAPYNILYNNTASSSGNYSATSGTDAFIVKVNTPGSTAANKIVITGNFTMTAANADILVVAIPDVPN